MAALGEMHATIRERLTADLRERGPDDVAGRPAPACPDWTVKDVVAHLAGVDADILAGNLEGVATDAWTSVHVDSRRDLPLAQILDAWSEDGPQVEAISSAFGPVEAQWLMDTLTHDYDARGGAGLATERDRPALEPSIGFLAKGFHRLHAGEGRATPTLVAGDGTWAPRDPGPVTVTAPDRFELLRGLTGRRSPGQLRAWDWTDDPEPFLPLFAWGPFTPRPDPLVE